MMNYVRIVWMMLLLGGMGALSPTVSAQAMPVVWRQAEGPYGGAFSTLATNPYTGQLWAAASGNVYVSEDGGVTWHARSVPRATSIFAFRSDGAIFTSRYRSYDQGASWTKMGLPDSLSVRAFAVAEPTGPLLVATSDGIFQSTDDGVQWSRREPTNVDRIWAMDERHFFARTREYDPRLLRSTDGGVSWHLNPVPNNEITLGFLPGPGDHAYLLTYDDADYRDDTKLYRTTDHGDTWELLAASTCFATNLLGFTPDGALIVAHSTEVLRLSADFQQCRTVFDDTHRNYPSGGRSSRSLRAVALDDRGRLFVYTGFGQFWRSAQDGQSWEWIQPQGILDASVDALYLDDRTKMLWAGAGNKGLFRSNDQGAHWTYKGFSTQSIIRIIAGKHPGELWAASVHYGLFHTQDYGATWTAIDSGIPGTLLDVRYNTNTGTLFVLSPVYDIYYSQDEGESWHPMNAPYASATDAPILGMALSPDGALVAMIRDDILAHSHGVYRTSDLGQTWEKIDQSFPRYPYGWTIFLFDATGRLWAGDGRDVYVSPDEGVTWTHAVSTSAWINTLLETPDGSLWVGHGEGLLRSIDGGQTWQEEDDGLGNRRVFSLAWDETNSRVWVGTHGSGVYSGLLNAQSTHAEDALVEHPSFDLGHYPNPVGRTATISFDLPQAASVRLTLYDTLGRMIQHLLDRPLPAGSHQRAVDMSSLPPGLYFYRLETPFGVFSKSMIHAE